MRFDSSYYNDKYFKIPGGKEFRRSDGRIDHWSYANPDGEWSGCDPIVKAWKEIFQCGTMLDAGCGRGTFVGYARAAGIEASGFDFSDWAISNPYRRCKKEWLRLHDATEVWPYPDRAFDLVTVLDLMEHIYMDDINSVINQIYRVSKKWVFLQIATVKEGSHDRSYILKKGEPVPIELDVYAVAGHVTVQTEQFWVNRFVRPGWRMRKDIVNKFINLVPHDVIRNWILNTMIVMERIET